MGSLLVPKITLLLEAKGVAIVVQKALKSLVDEMILLKLDIWLARAQTQRHGMNYLTG